MNDADLHHLAAAYALDALDADERAAFEAHLSESAVSRADVRAHRETAAALGSTVEAAPPPGLKASVMDEIARTRQLAPAASSGSVDELASARRRRNPIGAWAIAAAAAVALFVAGIVVAGQFGGDSFEDRAAAVLATPNAQIVDLAGDGAGTVRVVFAGGEVAVFGDGLTAAGAGRAYELWAIDAAGGATPLRLLADSDGGTVREIVDVDLDPVAFGVTIEDEDGADAPSDPILFLAEIDTTT